VFYRSWKLIIIRIFTATYHWFVSEPAEASPHHHTQLSAPDFKAFSIYA